MAVDWTALSELVAKVTALGGTLGGVALGVWHKVVIPGRQLLEEERERRRKQDMMFKAVEQIALELRPNGGSSLRDSLDRVELGVQMLGQRFRIALYETDKGVLEFDSAGSLIWANRTFRDMLGRDMEELAGDGWVNGFPHERRETILDEWNGCVVSGRDWEADRLEFINRDTAAKVVGCMRVIATRNSRGKALGWTATVTNCGPDCLASTGPGCKR